jgi:diguanylate cyclase (GGDEF)-like protein/PAS domain S-box-containing protein
MPSADIKVRPRGRGTALALLIFICLIVAVIIGQTWWASTQDRLLSIDSEKKHALVAVRGLEEHANQIFDGANRAVDATIKKIRVSGADILEKPGALQRILEQEQRDTPYLQSIRYIDLNGISRITSFAPSIPSIDVSDRQYVQFLNAHPQQSEAAIGHPVKSRYDNQWIVPIARNLYDAAGRRIGLISAYILVPYFEEFYQRVAKENGAIVALYSNNGFMLLHSPFKEKLAGKDASDSIPLQTIRKGPTEGTFEEPEQADGRQLQLFAYRKIANFPVTSVYARDMDEVLAGWKRRTTDRILFAGAAIGFVLALAALLALQIRRLQKSANRLSASEDRYKLLFDGANDAILLWNLKQVYVDCNEAAAHLFGMPDRQHIIGRKVGDFSPPEQPLRSSMAQTRQHYIDATLQGEVQRFEWATVRNGKLCDSEVTLSRAEINNETLVLAIFHDISARKYAQALQNGQNRILHMIAAGDELDNILTEIALFMQKHAPHICCGIMLLNDAQTHFSYGITPGWTQAGRIAGMPVAMGNGCCSETVLSRCPVIIENFPGSPSVAGLEKWLGPLNFASSGSWPIMGKHGQILGALSLLYSERLTPDAADMQLVGISTDLAGIAIESRKAEEWILHLAHYDELTGLPNRFLFIQHLHKALMLAERQQQAVAVLFLDLDRFKNINDTFGHEIGDQVLHDTAARMRLSLREEDTIARVGGDEFLALIENYQDPRQLAEIALRLLAAAAAPFEINHHDYQLSVSIGIATYPVDGLDTQTLLKNADIAMYRAKTTGKNNYQFYSAEMNTHSVERALLEARLRKAIEQREFVVHYQPKIDAQNGRIVGAEALVRWQHPERGLLYPGEFIALAEEAGQIGALGKLVLDIACRDIAELDRGKHPFGRIAINLSAAQFNQAGLLEQISHAVASHAISPSSLEFEITESMIMHSREQAIELMNRIRALGCSLSIDDFGTGYSSLAYLKRFPVNNLKIDKSFINDISSSPNDSAIVQAIIVMAHTLGLEVIAEGVETETQLQMLQQFDCDIYQGFYFSPAVPASEFTAMIEQQGEEFF